MYGPPPSWSPPQRISPRWRIASRVFASDLRQDGTHATRPRMTATAAARPSRSRFTGAGLSRGGVRMGRARLYVRADGTLRVFPAAKGTDTVVRRRVRLLRRKNRHKVRNLWTCPTFRG